MQNISLSSRERNEQIDITERVERAVSSSGVRDGFCMVYTPHTTAAITINENADPDVQGDITKCLAKLIPEGASYSHSEGNSDAHIKSSLVGSSVNLIVEKGKLALGRWQGIFFCEFDGPRQREVWVKIIGDRV